MASRIVSLIQDQNLNVQFNGKANISKAPRKPSTGGRKPLGDLSNSVNPTAKQTSKKESSKIISFTEKETIAFKLPNDSSKKKSVPKASEKVQASGRKALSDISNSGKPHLQGTSKNQTAKLCIPEDIAEEGFLHNHEECIKAQKRAISTNEFLRILGLDDFCKRSASAKQHSLSNKMEPTSPSRDAKMNEITAMLIEELSPPKHKLSRKLDSCPASPEAPDHYMQWDDPKYIPSFKLIESP
ncbi:Translational activator gcn1 [Gossypium arboreum]|uniref:Translational activator gcn1 n=1 Tax=Gossypium arboreum TaxID=29729 RepID=A0A0B0PG07_GOSAR|nr:Translational activator gcn1 [Gossypium arboreum]